jgi:NADPH dehydrogenase (quinone)
MEKTMKEHFHLVYFAGEYGATGSTIKAAGQLNAALAQTAVDVMGKTHSVTATNTVESYDAHAERARLAGASIVVFQFPMYWFSAPAPMKAYMDDVYIGEHFWDGTNDPKRYGRMGKLQGKYMLAVTMNSPRGALEIDGVLKGQSIDSLLLPIHVTQQYIGLAPLPTFFAHNVYHAYTCDRASGEAHIQAYQSHLTQHCNSR